MSGQGENDDVVNEAEAILNRDLKVSSHTQKRCKRSSTLSVQNLDVAQGTERGLADFRSSLLSLLAATQAQLTPPMWSHEPQPWTVLLQCLYCSASTPPVPPTAVPPTAVPLLQCLLSSNAENASAANPAQAGSLRASGQY